MLHPDIAQVGESAATHSRIWAADYCGVRPRLFCARTFGAALVLRDLRWSFGSSSAKRAIRALSAAAEYARHCRGTLQNGGRRHQAHSRDRRRVSPVESRNPGAAEATGTGLAVAHEFAAGAPTVVSVRESQSFCRASSVCPLQNARRPQIQPKVANGSTRAKTARAKKEGGGRRFVERRRASARQQRSNGALRR